MIAVSEFSKREIVELAGVDPDRVDVVPNALEPVFHADGDAAEGDYVLAVGTLEPRKNLAARRRGDRARRRRAARSSAHPAGATRASPGRHVTWLGRIDDEELAAAYRGARCLVFPSLYEGFGIPAARGDGLRHAGRDQRRERDGGGRRRRRRARRPARRRLDRGRHRGGRPAPRRARPARPRAGARVHVGARRRGGGRRRTGGRSRERAARRRRRRRARPAPDRRRDATCANLLRELARSAADAGFRFAAVTRHPELVPDGIEPLVLRTPVQELRMLWTLPRLLRRVGAALVHTQYALPARSPCPAVVTIHDLSFEHEPAHMALKDRLVFRRVVPRAARARAPRAHGLRAHRADLVELYGLPGGEGRRDAERRRPRVHARATA